LPIHHVPLMTSISQFHNQYPTSSSSEMESNGIDVSSDLSSTSYNSSSFPLTEGSTPTMEALTKSTNTPPPTTTPANPATTSALSEPASDDLALEGEYSDDDAQDLPILDESEHVLDDEEDDLDNEVPIAVRLTTDNQTMELFNTASSVQSSSPTGTSSQNSGVSSVLFQERGSLFRDPLHLFMEALQEQLGVVNDISLYFPQLQLKFHTHMPFSESLSLLDLSFLASKANPDYDNVLEVTLSQDNNNFVVQYNRLLDLADDGTESEDEDDDEDQVNPEGPGASGEVLLAKRSREGDSEENAKRPRLEKK